MIMLIKISKQYVLLKLVKVMSIMTLSSSFWISGRQSIWQIQSWACPLSFLKDAHGVDVVITPVECSVRALGKWQTKNFFLSSFWVSSSSMVRGQTLLGNTKGGSIIVPLTSCLTGLDQPVLQIKTKIVICCTAD